MQLEAPSRLQLGFGTQFLDMNLDGKLELFVANGHIDDLSRFGRPYRMPAQVFRLTGSQFEEVSATELGPYFQQRWLGRAVARIDWNRDGREDLLVGQLDDESALLTNSTTEVGEFVALRLFGVLSNRDAVGAVIRATIGTRTLVRQVTAGDGYQTTNERRIVIGCGSAKQIEVLTIHWPSGTTQRFENVATGGQFWIAEGGGLFAVP